MFRSSHRDDFLEYLFFFSRSKVYTNFLGGPICSEYRIQFSTKKPYLFISNTYYFSWKTICLFASNRCYFSLGFSIINLSFQSFKSRFSVHVQLSQHCTIGESLSDGEIQLMKASSYKFMSFGAVIRERRLKLAGHLWRNKKELSSSVLFWSPKHGRRSVGRPLRTYTDQLVDDTGLRIEDIPVAMSDRLGWRERIKVDPRSHRHDDDDDDAVELQKRFPFGCNVVVVQVKYGWTRYASK